MTLQDIAGVLAAKTVNGVLTLGPGDLSSSDIDSLLSANFPQGKLVLQGATLQSESSQINLNGGTTTLFGAAAVPATAVFTLANNTPELVLTCTPPSYNFGAGFPVFAKSALSGVAFGDAQFILSSSGNGVAFSGSYALPSPLQAIAQLLKAPDTITFSGPLVWVKELPQLTLTSTIFSGVQLGNVAADVRLVFGATVMPADSPTGRALAVPLFQLQSSLDITATDGTKTVAITADVPLSGGALLNLTAALDDVSLADLAGLATLAGDLSLPPDIPIASEFDLTQLGLVLSPATAKIVGLSVQIKSAKPWSIVADQFSVETVWINFTVNDPFGSSRQVFTTLGGSLRVNKSVEVDLSYALPGNMLTAQLASGSTIPLSSILSGFLPDTGLPALSIVELQLGLDVVKHDFQFEIDIKEDWPIDAGGSSSLTFGELLLYLSRTGEDVAARVFCSLKVSGAAVQLSADYQTGQGWIFAGGTLGEQNISLTDLVGDALSLFGLDLPATAPQVVIKNLQMSLATLNQDFSFACDGTVTVMDTVVGIGVDIARAHDQPSNAAAVSIAFKGYLTIGGQKFTADFKSAVAGKSILFKWQDTGEPLGFEAIASFFDWSSMPALPENLDLALEDAELYYDFNAGTVVVSAHSKNYGQLLFASLVPAAGSPNAGQRVYLFELDVPLNVQLSDLPVVGEKMPADINVGVQDLQVIIASAALGAADMTALNTLITGALGDTALIPTTLGSGLTFAAKVLLGTSTQPIVVPLTGGATVSQTPAPSIPAAAAAPASVPASSTPAPSAPAPAAPAPAAPSYQAGAKWFNIQKTFGPVCFERIGLQYQDSTLFFLLDASLTFSALSFALEGLGIGSPLTEFKPKPHLDGIAVAFSSGPVTISGGILAVPENQLPKDVDYEYIGQVTIAVEPYMIAGVAAYAKVSGKPSFFLFAQIQGEFGGPPAFFITGFMAGFGYNSKLALPEADQVYKFPFVAGLDDPTIFGADPTPMSVLDVITGSGGKTTAWVTPSVGEYWIAAGIMFTSFELVLGHALLAVEFGDEFEVALLGLASTSLPQGATTDAYAYIELQLEIIFKPDDGYFGLTASLTPNSFVIVKDCHLTGGFAFCLWFGSNPHAGDFVVTVGGYHPAFVVPAWYPRPAPVGFNWKVDSDVTIKGGAYFALTPSAVMAGGSLEVLFESGAIKAWFTAYADLLITWKPFHFNADIGISIGASVRVDLLFTTVTLSFELGATLELWGPPTGGIAHVHLYIVSFSVPFGAGGDGGTPASLDWTDFQTLLPQPSTSSAAPAAMRTAMPAATTAATPLVLGIQANRGLTRQDSSGTWYVRADELIFSSATAVPATSYSFGAGGTPPLAPGATAVTPPSAINIRPMAATGVSSAHSVTLTSIDEKKEIDLSTWTQVPQTRNLPEAMWGAPLPAGATPAPSSAMIPGLPTGVQLIAPPATVGASPGAMNLSSLVDPLGCGAQPLTPSSQADPIPAPVADSNVISEIMSTLGSAAAQTAQQKLVAALTSFQAAPPTSAVLTNLAAQAGQTFSQAPLRAS